MRWKRQIMGDDVELIFGGLSGSTELAGARHFCSGGRVSEASYMVRWQFHSQADSC